MIRTVKNKISYVFPFDNNRPMRRFVLPTVRSSIQDAIPLAVPTAEWGTTWGIADHNAT